MATLKESTFSGSNGSHFKLRLDMTYTQDTTLNQTTIRLSNYFVSQDGWSGSGSANSITGYINNSKVGTTDSIGVNASKLLGYRDIVITHNADGTFPDTNYSARIDSGWNNVHRAEVSGTLTSSNIPRIDRIAIVLSAENFTDEDNPTITFSNPSNYTIKPYMTFYDKNGTLVYSLYRDISATSPYTWEITNEERTALRLATNQQPTYNVYLGVDTFNGSTKLGANSIGKTFTIANATPTYDITYQDTNATSLAITQNNQQIIQNISTLQFNISNATALKGATLTDISIEINGVTQTQSISTSTLDINYGTINVANNINANVILTDSRGLTNTKQIPLTILGWELPNAIITLNRKNNYYTETDIKVDANYSSLDSKNTILIQYRDKKKSEENYGNWNNLSDNVTTTFNADNEYEWDIQVKVQDLLGSTTYNLSLGIGIPIFFIDRRLRNAGVRCFPKSTNAFEVNGNTEITGDLLINSTNILNKITQKGRTRITFDKTSNWTTSSTTATEIASTTLTTYGGDILVFVSMNLSVTGNMAFIELFVDDTNKGQLFNLDAGAGRQQISGLLLISGIASGSHDFNLKIHVQNNSNVATLYSYNSQQMTIVEL